MLSCEPALLIMCEVCRCGQIPHQQDIKCQILDFSKLCVLVWLNATMYTRVHARRHTHTGCCFEGQQAPVMSRPRPWAVSYEKRDGGRLILQPAVEKGLQLMICWDVLCNVSRLPNTKRWLLGRKLHACTANNEVQEERKSLCLHRIITELCTFFLYA